MNPDPGTIRPLPMKARPRQGETVESYIHRLAQANHLRPSYLRRLLLHSPDRPYSGTISLDRLAALTGRSTTVLEQVFNPPPPRHRTTRQPAQPRRTRRIRTQADKPALFTAIREAAANDEQPIKVLASQFRTHPRTVRQALIDPTPPARKKPVRSSYVLHGLHDPIDAMLHENPAIPAGHIWERLIDHHAATASYSTVRDYVARRRANSDKIH